jgi:hypothetical protein
MVSTVAKIAIAGGRVAAGGTIGAVGVGLAGAGTFLASSRTASPEQDTPGYHPKKPTQKQ